MYILYIILLAVSRIVVIHETEGIWVTASPLMRGRFGLCLWPGLCRLGTFAAMVRTLCTPLGVHMGWRLCWLLYPYTLCRYAPPAGAAAAPPWGDLQKKKEKFILKSNMLLLHSCTVNLYINSHHTELMVITRLSRKCCNTNNIYVTFTLMYHHGTNSK